MNSENAVSKATKIIAAFDDHMKQDNCQHCKTILKGVYTNNEE